MRRMRSRLLLAAVTLIGLGAFPLAAQVAPSLTGDTGLFELRNADMLQPGRFSFGLFFSQWDRTAAPSITYPPGVDDPLRYGVGKVGISVAYGVTSIFELNANTGPRFYAADPRDWSGVIGGHDRQGRIRHSETDKIRLGAKVLMNPKGDLVKVALFGGLAFPTQARSDPNAMGTYRTDYDFGVSFSSGIVTFETMYLLAGDLGETFDVPNELKFGLGFAVPIVPNKMKAIAEFNRIHFDGGTTKPHDFTEALAGVRFGFGDSGLSASGAVRVNIDRWVKYGNRPNNIGGLVQIAWTPQPPPALAASAPPAATPEEPVSEPAATEPPPPAPADTQTPSPTPSTVEPPPPPRAETSTTDEVLYDSGKSRLTNIAKAILDGVALRLKNNLSATCTIVGHADKGEKGEKMGLARARAEAAKDYLVKRHGIDAGRIAVDARGDVEAGPDAVRNRRAVVTVTFP